jgi:hypothetical protein
LNLDERPNLNSTKSNAFPKPQPPKFKAPSKTPAKPPARHSNVKPTDGNEHMDDAYEDADVQNYLIRHLQPTNKESDVGNSNDVFDYSFLSNELNKLSVSFSGVF